MSAYRSVYMRHIDAANDSELEYQLCASGQTSPVDPVPDETAAHVERLLNKIAALRGERDGLRRDLEFLNAENRFAVQSLEAKLAIATSAPVTPAYTDTEFTALQGYVEAFQEQADRSARATVALALVVQHVEQDDEAKTARIQALSEDLTAALDRLHHMEQTLQERQQIISSLEHQLASTSGAIGDTESHITGLRATIERLERELASERNSHAETGVALSDTEAQLTAVSEALTDAEAARDALALEKTHLESDLDTARQDLEDAEARHSEQVTALSAGAVSGHGAQAALRAHIHELEERVQRRTEQIGIHQHDIKRLETNMKLQEDRLAELTQELEVVQNEKEAMLEDCRTTREQRDDAMRRCEELEDAMEGVEETHALEVEAMVGVTFEAIAAQRDAIVRSRHHRDEIALLQERVGALESERAALASQLAGLQAERDQLSQSVEQNSFHAQSQLEEVFAKARATEEAKATVEAQLAAAQGELEDKNRELTSLQNQLAAARASDADRQSMEAAIFAQEKADLQAQLKQAQSSLSELQTVHDQTVHDLKHIEEELKRAEDELATHLANSAARSEAEERLRQEMAEVRQQHAEEAEALEEQLKSVADELQTMARLRGEADASRMAVEEELTRTRQQLESRLAEAGETLNTASRLESELEQLKASHGEEMRNLRAQLDALNTELQDVTRSKDELQALHEQALHESQQRGEEASEVHQKAHALEIQLSELRVTHAQELQDMQKRLEEADLELQNVKASAETQQRDAVDELTRKIEELQARVTALTKEADECRMELDEERAAHALTRETATAELREISAIREEAESAFSEAEGELTVLRAQLDHAEASLREMEELQYQATNLEAEVQRAKSLQRFLESQVAEGYVASSTNLSIKTDHCDREQRVASLEAECAELRTRCTTLDKRAQATEANLAMQTIQHEQTVATLRRELNVLRSQPSMEEEIADLKEKNAEYEELLRAKCLEIEENDDKFIEYVMLFLPHPSSDADYAPSMLKEKKKLNSKIDSLSRKVQNLQTKLAAATEAAAKAAEAPAPSPPAPAPAPISAPAPTYASAPRPPTVFSPSVLQPAAIITTSSASSSRTMSRSRVVTAPAMPSLNTAAPIQHPPMPAFRPKTPESSRKRMMSGPSSISRPKTPESRVPALPVFKARTPERHRIPTTSSLAESSSSSSSLIGVKRRAPDDFDDCATVPPQTFTADSAPLGYATDGTPAQPTTPRLRRALQTMRTGFTPIRHHSNRAGSASPRRATTGAALGSAPLPTISDVTNSPRSSARHEPVKAAKKGWLGKIKSAPSQPRAFSTRQPVFDPPGMR